MGGVTPLFCNFFLLPPPRIAPCQAVPVNAGKTTSWAPGWKREYQRLCPDFTEMIKAHRHAVRGRDAAPYIFHPLHGGLGDRLRGLVRAFLVSLASARPLKVLEREQMTRSFLVSSGILADDLFIQEAPPNTLDLTDKYGLPDTVSSGQVILDFVNQGLQRKNHLLNYSVALMSNDNGRPSLDVFIKSICQDPNAVLPHVRDKLCAILTQPEFKHWWLCVFRAMFHPSAKVLAAVDTKLQGPSYKYLVGLHIRYGNMKVFLKKK